MITPFIMAFGLIGTHTSYGHFFKVEHWTNNVQNILLVSDFHTSTKPENSNLVQQREQLVSLAIDLNAGVIVEDGMIYGDDLIKSSRIDLKQGVFPEKMLDSIKIETPLHGLHSLCKIKGVDCINAEYRFSLCRPLNIYYDFFKNKKDQILNQFKEDGALFENYYKQRMTFLEQTIEKPFTPLFNAFKQSSMLLNDYLKKTPLPFIHSIDTLFTKIASEWNSSIDYAAKVSIILTNYTATFLDCEIIHGLSLFKNKKTVIICAGDLHIQEMKRALPQLGYNQQASQGQDLAIIAGAKYQEPNALELHATVAAMNIKDNNQKVFTPFWLTHSFFPLGGLRYA